MKRMMQVLALVGAVLASGGTRAAAGFPESARERAQEAYCFAQPAERWTEGLPIGNGRLAALWVGASAEEIFFLNEESVWKPPLAQPVNPQGAALLPEIRRLLFAGEEAAAHKLCEEQFLRGGAAVSPYLPLAALTVRQAVGAASDYRRGIRLDEGTAYTTFRADGVRQQREAFVAYDEGVLVITYRADAPLELTFSLGHPGALGTSALLPPNQLHLQGSTGPRGVAFDVVAAVVTDGSVAPAEGALRVSGAKAVTLFLTAYTDFNRAAPDQPLTSSRLARCQERLRAVIARGAAAVQRAHVQAFRERYCRAYVTLGAEPAVRPLAERWAAAREAEQIAPDFLLLNYDFYRYLLLSGSRAGGLPMNLQGKWNPLMAPPWESDWHLDINLSMAYWPACAWGLAEVSEPLTSLAEMAFPRSRRVAREMLGADGCFLGTCTDLWGSCAPFRLACWGMNVSGGAWLLQDALEPLRYTADASLAGRLLLLLREQCRFYLAWLVRHPQSGRWVSGPVMSPENTYCAPGGGYSAIDMGPAYDQETIALTFRSYLRLAADHGSAPDAELCARVRQVLTELAMPQVGPDGALQEWSRPYAEAEPAHRHLSFAYALMPGHDWEETMPAGFAEAVRKRLDLREAAGHHLMGWSLGHMACLRARLGQAEEALRVLDQAPRYLTPNLFTTATGHPQVADMGGVPAALNEMLLRSEHGVVEVLPALPQRLAAQGSFRLMAARGLWVTCAWQAGRPTRLEVTASQPGDYTLRYPGGECTLRLNAGQRRVLPLPD